MCAIYIKEWEGSRAFAHTDPLNSLTLILDDVFVPFERRGKGEGSAIILSIEAWAREQGCVRITGKFQPELGSDAERSENFYKKLGIIVVENFELQGEL